MCRRLATPFCLMLFAVAGAAANASPAQAGQVGSFVINNRTNVPINFVIRWGTVSESTVKLPPGGHWASIYSVDSSGMVPTPSVSFDAVGGDDEVTSVTYELDTYLVDEQNFLDGKDYSFKYQSNGVVLELFED
jgi:hypothetical protein